SNMSASYIVDIAVIIQRGPHNAIILGALSGLTQSTFNVKERNPLYRTLFNMAILVLTIEAAGWVFEKLGGSIESGLTTLGIPLVGMAVAYFLVNTAPVAVAIALATRQSAWRIWKTEFASSAP